ncbi:low specificity L-threonine aldolase [Anoxynatronum sibiricum]|uniref:Low specificity L-threonine aldolase n=1 Tax=Anoxynatronum sibiricum TaxID=210623 RepID=A0ABU9VPJ5_9CLOT
MKSDAFSFASDNCAGVHPTVMAAMAAANEGYVHSYGDDVYTREAVAIINRLFGGDASVFLVYNGTGANVTGISHLIRSYQTVYCAAAAHIHVDECGSLEHYAGCKVVALPSDDGKITSEAMEPYLVGIGDEHRSQPGLISITQPTEYGVLYTPDEIRHLADFAHGRGMKLHMDGARIANASAALNLPVEHFTTACGVDLVSFGAAKNGMMFGEAVVFLDQEAARAFPYVRKQGMQLHSKMRFMAAQFIAMLTDDLWLENARHANAMTRRLHEGLCRISEIKVTRQVHCNAIFACFPKEWIVPMQERFHFYVWDESVNEVRLMTSFQTTTKEVDAFLAALIEEAGKSSKEGVIVN